MSENQAIGSPTLSMLSELAAIKMRNVVLEIIPDLPGRECDALVQQLARLSREDRAVIERVNIRTLLATIRDIPIEQRNMLVVEFAVIVAEWLRKSDDA